MAVIYINYVKSMGRASMEKAWAVIIDGKIMCYCDNLESAMGLIW